MTVFALKHIIVIWLACSVLVLGSVLLPDPGSLPTPRQSKDRILIANTVADLNGVRQSTLVRQMHAYVAACDAGFEVHVVIVTMLSDWDEPSNRLFPTARNLCDRLRAEVPVAISLHSKQLASQHRQVFTSKHGMYDLYMSHEDDFLFKPHHFQYFQYWSNVFKSNPLLMPGFFLYEVPLHYNSGLLSYAPSTAMDDGRTHGDLFWWNGEMFVMYHNGYSGSYILTDEQLKHYSELPFWREAAELPWDEFNVPFQGQWLSRYVHRVIPLSDITRALLHHTSNKYVNKAIQKAATQESALANSQSHSGQRLHGPDISEVLMIYRQCTGMALATPMWQSPFNTETFDMKFSFNNTNSSATSTPCNICFKQGHVAEVLLKFSSFGWSAYQEGSRIPRRSTAQVNVFCKAGLRRQWVNGCGKGDLECQWTGVTFWGPMLSHHTAVSLLGLKPWSDNLPPGPSSVSAT